MAYYAVGIKKYIKTHDSESQGQEEAIRDEQMGYLHVALLKTLQVL